MAMLVSLFVTVWARMMRPSGGWLLGAAICVVGLGPASADEIKATFDEKGLTFKDRSEAVSFELGGRLHADFGSGGSRATTDEFPDAARSRRLWIEPKLTIGKDLIFNFQYDASSASMPINNLLVSYKGLPSLIVTAGQFKEPFSLEQLLSNNDTTFMERSLVDAFAPSRNTGVAVGYVGHDWTLSAGAFGGNLNSTVDKGGLAGTVRATVAPIKTDAQVLHFGVAGSYRSVERRGPSVSFSTRPESDLFRTSLVDTETIDDARSISRIGAEAAFVSGPLRIQTEYVATQVERNRAPSLTLQGGYVYATWVLNGSGPKYALDADTATEIGVFKGVRPTDSQRLSRGGIGLFELAARCSTVTLSDRDVRGGVQQDVTAGINWYPETTVRVMANYVRAWADPSTSALTGRPARADIGQVRLQIAF